MLYQANLAPEAHHLDNEWGSAQVVTSVRFLLLSKEL